MAEYQFPRDDAARDDDDAASGDDDFAAAIDDFFDATHRLIDNGTRRADDVGRRILRSTAGVLTIAADRCRRAADGDVDQPEAAADDGVTDE